MEKQIAIAGNQRMNNWVLPIVTFFLVCGLWSMVNGQNANQLYQSANSLYKANQFEQAAAAYEKILVQGYRNAEVHYNLGNCYYKLKNTGRAILNYERAHKLLPEDEDIAHNLKLAQLKTIDKLVPVPQLAITSAFKNFSATHSSKGWSWYALGAIWLCLIIFAVYLFVAKKTWIPAIGFLFLFASGTFFSLALKQKTAEQNSGFGILLTDNVVVKSAPDENGTNLFTIHEGIKFEVLDAVGSWNKIRLIDGKVGWLGKNLFEKI